MYAINANKTSQNSPDTTPRPKQRLLLQEPSPVLQFLSSRHLVTKTFVPRPPSDTL